jgi:transposase InsO family protein
MSAARSTATKEWFTAAEIAEAKLPGMPETERGVQLRAIAENWPSRPRQGRGGGLEFPLYSLPLMARAAIALLVKLESEQPKPRPELAKVIGRLNEKQTAKAKAKIAALEAVTAMIRGGTPKVTAMMMVAAQAGVQVSSLYNWERTVFGLAPEDWLAALAPRHSGGTPAAGCDGPAWDFIRADWLRPERPAFTACFRRLEKAAAEHGWTLPAARTLERRLLALPEAIRTLAREGLEAVKQRYPAQERRRSHFHALEAVNADGHKWDVFVKWPDGSVARPMMCVFQDLYSGKILSWRVDRTATKDLVRLAFGDVVDLFGIPDHCWLDNGRDFASHWITGGTPNRYRFKIKDEQPDGIMTMLGVAVHWTTPYAGQSKPIERAFRDFAGDIAKHPAFAGAYVGHNPLAKPENYGSKAVPLETFLKVVGEGIIEHNARAGRRSHVAQMRSFDAVFAESYSQSPIRKAADWQRRLWLLAAEGTPVSKRDASITLLGNRYWAEFLMAWRGKKLIVRFDPQALQEDLQVYRPDGAYLGAAPVIEAAGFNDVDAARRHNEARKHYLKGVRMQLDAERRMTIDQVAALLPKTEAAEPPPAPKVVRMVNGPSLTAPAPAPEEQSADERLMITAVRQLRLVRDGDGLE